MIVKINKVNNGWIVHHVDGCAATDEYFVFKTAKELFAWLLENVKD